MLDFALHRLVHPSCVCLQARHASMMYLIAEGSSHGLQGETAAVGCANNRVHDHRTSTHFRLRLH